MTERITPDEYFHDESVKQRADELMNRFGVDPTKCREIEISNDGHLVAFEVRHENHWCWIRKFMAT